MCKVLYIKANVDAEGRKSNTFMISDHFVKEYIKQHPKDEITTLDLNKEKIKSLTNNDILSAIIHKYDQNKNHPVLKYAFQFAAADKYIVAEPMWKSGITAILNYIDYVGIMDIAYKYTEYGTVGLLKGKKAVAIASRDLDNCSEPFCFNEMGEEHLKKVFAFFGITDYTTIFTDKMDSDDEDVHEFVSKTIKKARTLTQFF